MFNDIFNRKRFLFKISIKFLLRVANMNMFHGKERNELRLNLIESVRGIKILSVNIE